MKAIQKHAIALLRWSEQYTKTDMTYLAKGGFWSTTGYAVQVALGILNTIVLANFLAKDLLGTYQFVLAMAGVFGIFTLTGMGSAVARAVAQGREEAFRSGVATKLRWSVGTFLMALAVSGYYWIQGDNTLGLAFLFVAITVPITESFVLYESYLQGKQAFKDNVTLGFWRKPLPVLALFITLYFTSNIPILVGVYLGTTMFSTLLIYTSVLRKYNPPVAEDTETNKYGMHLSILGVLHRVAEHADKVLLWYLLGPVAVASFTIAQLATKYSGGMTRIITQIALPRVAQRDLPTLQKTLPRKVLLFSLGLVPAVLVYVVLIPFVFSFLFPDYSESILLAQVMGIVILFLPRSLYGQALVAHQQVRSLAIISILAPTVKISGTAIFIFFFGIWGAVYGVILGETAAALLSWYFFKIGRPLSQESDLQ